MSTLHVLYVDDEPDIREIAAMALELDPGFEVRTAASGFAALDLLKSGGWRAEVILLDLMMPGLDGHALLGEVRKIHGCATTPVIFVTARTQAADIDRLIAQGATAVITKPFDPMLLAKQVRAILDL